MIRLECLALLLLLPACGKVIGLGPERSLGGNDSGTSDASDAGDASEAGDAGDSGQNACSGALLWMKQFGDASSQVATSIVPDGAGGVYIAGSFEGALDFGGLPLVSQGGSDIFLARLDAEGNEVWSKRFGGPEDQAGILNVNASPDGVIFSGEVRGSADLGDGNHFASGFADGFIASYDEQGKFLWNRWIVGPSIPHSEAVKNVAVVDSSLYAVTIFTESVTFLGQTFTSEGLKDNLFTKLDAGGNEVWTFQFGGDGDEALNWIVANSSGRLVAGGSAAGALSLGQEVLPISNAWDTILGVYEPINGAALTTRRYPGPGDTGVTQMASYPASSDVLVAGRLRFGASIDFGDGEMSAQNGTYLARLAENLDPVATRSVENFDYPDAVAILSGGDALVGGTFVDSANFKSGPIPSTGGRDVILLRLDPQLETLWAVQLGSSDDDELHGMAVDAGGPGTFAFGHFSETLSISGAAQCADLTSQGGTDLMLIKLAP
jgi:hypothetical protein